MDWYESKEHIECGYIEMRRVSADDLDSILTEHKLWLLADGQHGHRADLTNANLRNRDLPGICLKAAKLKWASIADTDLSDADLSDADLSNAFLQRANLTNANFRVQT